MNGKAKSKQEIREETQRRKEEKRREKEARAKERKKEQVSKWQEKQRDKLREKTYRELGSGHRRKGIRRRPGIDEERGRSPENQGPRIRPERTRRMGIEGDEVDGDRIGKDSKYATQGNAGVCCATKGQSPSLYRSESFGDRKGSDASTPRGKKRGHQRTRDIKRAIREAKKRDGYRCKHCGETPVHGAHLLPRNVSVPEYHPANPDWIVTLCGKCHYVFDSGHTVKAKLKCAKAFGLDREARMLKILVDKGW